MSPNSHLADDRARLAALLRSRSLRTGRFTLSSGAESAYYIDARRTTMCGEGLMRIGRLGLATLRDAGWQPSAIGGLTLGADPIAYAIAHTATLMGQRLNAFSVRKAPKAHGTGRRVEGCLEPGGDVVIVEDAMTTGESALQASAVATAEGAHVLGIFTLVDRDEGGRARIEEAGYRLVSLFTAKQLLAETA